MGEWCLSKSNKNAISERLSKVTKSHDLSLQIKNKKRSHHDLPLKKQKKQTHRDPMSPEIEQFHAWTGKWPMTYRIFSGMS